MVSIALFIGGRATLTPRNSVKRAQIPSCRGRPLVLAIPTHHLDDEFLVFLNLVLSSEELAHRCTLPSIVAGRDTDAFAFV